jgi:murein DD-endopeptidase MepM/ murein hydrolase activator NlpD
VIFTSRNDFRQRDKRNLKQSRDAPGERAVHKKEDTLFSSRKQDFSLTGAKTSREKPISPRGRTESALSRNAPKRSKRPRRIADELLDETAFSQSAPPERYISPIESIISQEQDAAQRDELNNFPQSTDTPISRPGSARVLRAGHRTYPPGRGEPKRKTPQKRQQSRKFRERSARAQAARTEEKALKFEDTRHGELEAETSDALRPETENRGAASVPRPPRNSKFRERTGKLSFSPGDFAPTDERSADAQYIPETVNQARSALARAAPPSKLRDKAARLRFAQDETQHPEGNVADITTQSNRAQSDNPTPDIPAQRVPDSETRTSQSPLQTPRDSKLAEKVTKLRFTAEERAPPGDPPKNAQAQKDGARRPDAARVSDQPTKKASQKLRFGEPPKTSRGAKIGANPEAKTPTNTAGAAHKIAGGIYAAATLINTGREAREDDNTSVQMTKTGAFMTKSAVKTAYRFQKSYPRLRMERQKADAAKTAKAASKRSVRRPRNGKHQTRSNPLSRFYQRQKRKQEYARAAREAYRTGEHFRNTATAAAKAAKALAGFFKRNPMTAGILCFILAALFIFSALFSSCSSMMGGGFPAIYASSYIAAEPDIDDAEIYYTEMETDLQITINSTPSLYPGYDEYRYEIGNIGHNPHELMAFLTTLYVDFTFSEVEGVLRDLFDQQYTLTYQTIIERRGESIWRVLKVTLTSRSFTSVIYPLMDADQHVIYSIIVQSKGNRQLVESPFAMNWLMRVSSYYGWRIHPITGVKTQHMGIDIGVPTGTDILSGLDGTVTEAAYDSGYGYYVTVTDGEGVYAKYAHCSRILVTVGQSVSVGDVIAKSGNSGSSTGPHLHFEVIKDGRYLNPIYFAVTNDDGRGPVFGDPGTPMGDGSYAAMIAEAEKYIGMPYVYGGSSPQTSFDCSGFVCWVINNSGVGSVGRTTAQGLYNLCTPVSPADAQPGDLIFFHSTYSHYEYITHVGIYVGDGMMLHAGNPIGYASCTTPYFTSHLYGYGRISQS